jgi:[ribosomal protein S18]-alanine N-acetyltransferase
METAVIRVNQVIREMIRDDAQAIARILAQSPGAALWSPAAIISGLDTNALSSTEILIAVPAPDSEITGFVVLRTTASEMEVLNLAVLPACRRRGIGSELLASAFSRARSAGAEHAFLEVRVSNAGAQAFYVRMGFTEVGRRRGYYKDPPEDAVILSRPLDECVSESSCPL